MGKVAHGLSRNLTYPPGTTRYAPLGTGTLVADAQGGVEAQTERTFRRAWTCSNLYCRVTQNGTSNGATVTVRKNQAAGNQSLSIGGGATGEFEDTTNTDSFSAGDEGAIEIAAAAGGPSNTLTFAGIGFIAEAASGTVTFLTSSCGDASGTSTTLFAAPCGDSFDWRTSFGGETAVERTARVAGTLRNLYVYVNTNGRSSTTVIGTRKNGANGSQSVSVGASATGVFEDTSNSDSLSAGDTYALRCTVGTGTGNLVSTYVALDYETTSNSGVIAALGSTVGFTVNQGATGYAICLGHADNAFTEAQARLNALVPSTLSDLNVYVDANSVSASSTVKLRKNGADGNQVVTIGAGSTGWFHDATNTDDVVATDEIAYQCAAGAGGTSLTFRSFGMVATVVVTQTPSPATVTSSWVVGSPTMTLGAVTPSPASVTSSWVVPSPTLQITYSPTFATVVVTWTVPAPSLTLGARSVTPASVVSTWTVPGPTVVGGAVFLNTVLGTVVIARTVSGSIFVARSVAGDGGLAPTLSGDVMI